MPPAVVIQTVPDLAAWTLETELSGKPSRVVKATNPFPSRRLTPRLVPIHKPARRVQRQAGHVFVQQAFGRAKVLQAAILPGKDALILGANPQGSRSVFAQGRDGRRVC
jgi:hypothetical protein